MIDFYLIWLAISGGVWGRAYSWLWIINLILMIVILLWPVKKKLPGRVTVWLLIFLASAGFSMWFNGNYNTGLLRLIEYATAIKLFLIAPPPKYWHGAMIYFFIANFLPENSNVIAINIWAFYFIYTAPTMPPLKYVWHGGALVSTLLTGSAGGLLAIIAGVTFQAVKSIQPVQPVQPVHNYKLAVPLLIIPFIAMLSSKTSIIRLTVWGKAIKIFSQHPLLGTGPGSFKVWVGNWGAIHAHNLILNTLAEGGLVGLIVLIIITIVIINTGLVTPYTIAFITHAMVDSPDLFLLPLFGLFINLGSCFANKKEETTPN